jgi:hypothetical protein
VEVGSAGALHLDPKHSASHNSFITHTGTIAPQPSAAPVDDAAEALFEEARQRARRRRRRRAAAAAALPLLVVATVLVLQPDGSNRARKPPRPQPLGVRPQTVLARVPYVGVACVGHPNSIACDRVGVAVWLLRPARRVTATIGGRSVVLDDREWSGPKRHGNRRMFAGFLQPAGLLPGGALEVQPDAGRYFWEGSHPVSGLLRLVIAYADGRERATALNVELSPGWG